MSIFSGIFNKDRSEKTKKFFIFDILEILRREVELGVINEHEELLAIVVHTITPVILKIAGYSNEVEEEEIIREYARICGCLDEEASGFVKKQLKRLENYKLIFYIDRKINVKYLRLVYSAIEEAGKKIYAIFQEKIK